MIKALILRLIHSESYKIKPACFGHIQLSSGHNNERGYYLSCMTPVVISLIGYQSAVMEYAQVDVITWKVPPIQTDNH